MKYNYYIFWLLIRTVGANSELTKVLTTTEDVTKFTDGSGAKLKNSPDFPFVDVTICLRFYDFLLVRKYLISSSYDSNTNYSSFSISEFVIPEQVKYLGYQQVYTALGEFINYVPFTVVLARPS